VTWEKASDIPPDVILKFEHGHTTVVKDAPQSKMGQTVHTLSVSNSPT